MDIYLTKDGKSVGPFTAEELRARIKAGDADLDESAWSAETGDWKRLELILQQAETSSTPAVSLKPPRFGSPQTAQEEDSTDDGGKKKGKKKRKEKKAAPPEEPKRERSSKLGSAPPPGVAALGGKKKGRGKGPSPVRALPGAGEQPKGKSGGGVSIGAGGLRWLALPVFAVFLFCLFLPWGIAEIDRIAVRANAFEQITDEPVEIPGVDSRPTSARTAKLLLIGGVALGLLAGVLAILGALKPGGAGTLAAVFAIVGAGCLGASGWVQGNQMETDINRTVERLGAMTGLDQGLVAKAKVEITQGAGFYLGIAALLLLAGFSLAPRGGSSPAPLVVLLVLGLGAAGYGVTKLGSDPETMFKDAFSEMKDVGGDLGGKVKEKAGEGIDAIKEKLDKDDPGESAPAPSDGSAADDPF